MKSNIKIIIQTFFLVMIGVLFITSSSGQTTIDLSNNLNDKNVNIMGTYVWIDTTGLNLAASTIPSAFINENDQTVFGIEQKQLSIDEYESILGMMLKFDSIITEHKVVFNEFTGKLIFGKVNIQGIDKDFWICYLGNKDFVVEIKGFYNSKLKPKYEAAFEKAIKSLFIDVDGKMSMYEDLPFHLDETKFPYKKELSFMPQSISISRDIDGHKRTISIVFFNTNMEEIEEMKSEFIYDSEMKKIGEKELITKEIKTDDKVTLKGIIIKKNQLIQIICFSSSKDIGALNEFKEIAESISFK